MSKLIVEMEMPICCADCPCCICLNGMKPAYCKAVMVDDDNIVDGLMWKETDPNDRPSWCPICGVLPEEHGELIDRDEMFDTVRNRIALTDSCGEGKPSQLELFERDVLCTVLHDVVCAKAVIAAERKDDDV